MQRALFVHGLSDVPPLQAAVVFLHPDQSRRRSPQPGNVFEVPGCFVIVSEPIRPREAPSNNWGAP